ncbi:CARDB domain-containing protein [Natronorubrum tibetense]|uniref:CARDB domain-containing protein n=1 Tax=Natronorubrum tibetense TaxID=63128 RepID=UPI000A7AEFFC|nr:CARDB domain-containing protein [Natronorubrum tibetense]
MIWWALASDHIIEISDVDGDEDTASIAPDASEIVPEGIMAWVVNEYGAVVDSDRWEFDYPDEGPTFEISSVQTNSPIAGGETLEVEATVENTSAEPASTEVELVVGHDPELVDSRTVGLQPGESAAVPLTFEAGDPARGREVFPGEVSTEDDSVEFTIVVEDEEPTPATFNVMEMSTNSPIGGGETLEVDTIIENIGDETGRTDIELIVGHDPQVEDSVMRTLDPGESSTFTLTFQAGDPTGGREEFPVVVDTGADTATETVVVEDEEPIPATFNVMETSTNSPVGGGETLEVDTTIENVGDEAGTTDIELIVGHTPQVEDSVMRTLAPGESSTFTLTFQAGEPAGGREEFPVVVDTGADTATETVAVID